MRRAHLTTPAILMAAIAATAHAQAPATQPAGAAAAATDVPVREVVLFSSGVGYFEHFGTVHGDGVAELRFKANQINDILKSLVLQDLDGGQVRAVTYPSQDPIAKTLKSFQVDITENPPLADLLNQLRGAKVTVAVNGEKTTGTVLGVERRRVVVKGEKGDDQTAWQPVLNLVSDGLIVAQPLEAVSSIKLDDPQLQEELTKALTALAGARDQDKKPVRISFGGTGDRRVRLGYVVETPVWKTSYRLILSPRLTPAEATTRPAADGQLQGWAIVENQTDNDWTNVQMKLVSGRPISFVEDLYQPLYVPRPVVMPDLYASLRPQTYGAGTETTVDAPVAAAPAGAFRGGGGGGGGFGGQFQANKALQQQMAFRRGAVAQDEMSRADGSASSNGQTGLPMDPTASVRSLASANSVGELFEFTVGSVSLPRQRSAMIPIITDPIEVERVSIYNQSVLPRNPLNGARVKNTTKKLLLAGPITVLDGATYAGDAQIDNVPAGQERLLSYGVDLQMAVDAADNKTADQMVTGKIVKGVLYVTHRYLRTQKYVAENKADHDKTLVVEHPRQGGDWALVDSPKPAEVTDAVYRFRESVPAGKSVVLVVNEQQTTDDEVAILQNDPGSLDFYRRAGEIPKPVQDALAKAIELKGAVVDIQRRIDEDKQKLADITAEQGRIRENLRSVERNGQYYARLMGKLNDQETAIEKTQGDQDDLQKQLDAAQKELESYLAGLNVG
jgi:hypothetical protein